MSTQVTTGSKTYFPNIGRIAFEGAESTNPLAFRYYDAKRVVAGRSLESWLRYAVSYWHSFCGNGADPFGSPTRPMPSISSAPRRKASRSRSAMASRA